MSLKVIGSGFGRTGTMSTKLALEQLGFGSCHHMTEVMGNPKQPAFWKAHVDGVELDWAEVFAEYTSQVDFPGAAVWHELSVAFPDAKVIHTERPEEDWWASYSATIGKFFELRESLPLPPPVAAIFETMDKLLIQGVMGGLDKVSAISAYRPGRAFAHLHTVGGLGSALRILRRRGAGRRLPAQQRARRVLGTF